MPRENVTFDRDPKRLAGLTARRIARGLPVGAIVAAMNDVDGGDAGSGAFAEAEDYAAGIIPANRPLEWWQVVENQAARDVARYRAEGRI